MPRMERYQAKFQDTTGADRTIYFSLDVPMATNSDRFYTGAAPIAGDVKISKDGGALANTANLPTHVGGGLWQLILSEQSGELQATDIVVMVVDADGPAFRDVHLQIETKIRIGQIDIDASQIGTSNSAIKAKASSGGYAFEGIAPSATTLPLIKGFLESMVQRAGIAQSGTGTTIRLDTGASSTDDYYNGAIVALISGTGIGQARVIVDYNGTNKDATVNRSWTAPASGTNFVILPGDDPWNIAISELATWVAADLTGSTTGQKLQFLFQRFAFKRTQTSGAPGTQTLIKNDGTTTLTTATVEDNGTTQTFGAHDGP